MEESDNSSDSKNNDKIYNDNNKYSNIKQTIYPQKQSNLINTEKLPIYSRNPHITNSKSIKFSNYSNKKIQFLPDNVMNLVSFFNSISSNNNINIPSLNTLTKLKSVNNFNQIQNNFFNNNINNLPKNDFNNINNENNLMNKYNQNYINLKNNENNIEDIIAKTAGKLDDIQKEEFFKSQPPNQNIKYKIDNGTNYPINDNIYKSYKNYNNYNNNYNDINNNGNVIDFNNYKANEQDTKPKIVQFNNVLVRSNKSNKSFNDFNKNKYNNNYY